MPDATASATRIAPVLELDRLGVEYAGRRRFVTALDGVSAAVGRGEIVALVGESGSGKSTIAAAATGLLPPSARVVGGRVLLDGLDVTLAGQRAWSRLRGRTVGLVPQDPGASLTPVRSIGSQLAEVLAVRGERLRGEALRRRLAEMLEVAEVPRAAARLSQFPHELSGGLKQRILIAMVFGLDPALVVADEPTSALDVTVQRQVLAVFDRLVRDHGTSVLFVTHDLALAADHASRVLVLQHGRLVDDVRVADVARHDGGGGAGKGAVDDGAAPGRAHTHQLLQRARATLIARPRPAEPSTDSSAPAGSPLLEVRGLRRVFSAADRGFGRRGAEVVAVDDVSFTVPRGQTVALVGESGSGKSTTARIVLRLTDPTAGQVLLDGTDVTAVTGRERLALRRQVQLVHQNPDSSLDPRWTVERTIAEPLTAMGLGSARERRARAAELIDAVGLPESVAASRPTALSGGQRQRVAIARALAPHSSLVVLDEALSALDVVTQDRVLTLLSRIQRETGVSYLFISHDLATVRLFAQHVVVLRHGRVVEQGPAAQVFEDPRSSDVRELLSAVPGRRLLAGHLPEPQTAGATS